MTHRWRCFVAIRVGGALRLALEDAVERWRGRSDLADLRWTAPDGWHVTLAFMGPITQQQAAAADSALGEVLAGWPASDHAPTRTGAFPRGSAARVTWLGIADDAGRLAALAAAVREAVGLRPEPPFRPHLTLARARRAVDARGWVGSAPALGASLAVDRVELLRSIPELGGSRYETLSAFALTIPAHV